MSKLFLFLMLSYLSSNQKCNQTMIQDKNTNAPVVNLQLQQEGSHLKCAMAFSNHSNKILYLNKLDICTDADIVSKIFIIKTDKGEVVPYSGIMIKRTAPTMDDFIALQPKYRVSTMVHLEDAYQFKTGRHSYTIQYRFYHGSPENAAELNELQSNIVSFSFEKQ
jgi:hypothetical protein